MCGADEGIGLYFSFQLLDQQGLQQPGIRQCKTGGEGEQISDLLQCRNGQFGSRLEWVIIQQCDRPRQNADGGLPWGIGGMARGSFGREIDRHIFFFSNSHQSQGGLHSWDQTMADHAAFIQNSSQMNSPFHQKGRDALCTLFP